MRSIFRDPPARVMPVGLFKVYKQNDYADTCLHIYQNGCVFLHVGEACISLTREQANCLLRDARGLWDKDRTGCSR